MNNIETWQDDLLSVACSLCLCNSACFDIYKNIACVAHKTATLLHLYP